MIFLSKNIKKVVNVKVIMTGLEIATNTVTFATKFFHFVTKISGEVANLQLIFNFRNKKG